MIHRRMRSVRRSVYRRIPLWVRQHDFELFTTLLCLFAGLPLLLSDAMEAQSLESQLPLVVVRIWAVVLTVAPIMVFVGIYRAHTGEKFIEGLFWMRMEAAGLRMLFHASWLYAFIILIATTGKSSPAAMVITVFALTCWTRAASVTIKVEDFLEGIGAK